MARTLGDEGRRLLERLRTCFESIADVLAASGWRHGCLPGNMALEAAVHSEAIRQCLHDIFAACTARFAEAIGQAQRAGEVRTDLDAHGAGAALLEALHGTMLRMKVERGSAPLDRFRRLTLPAVLPGAPAS